MHTMPPGFEFDPAKNAANQLKHGVAFSEAATCLLDPLAIVVDDAAQGEARMLMIGHSDRGRLLAVSYTLRGDVARLISARKATARERASYAR